MSALLEAREWTASAPTGRIFTLKGASIIQLEGKKIASDHAHFYRRAVDEPLGTSDIRKDSIIEANLPAVEAHFHNEGLNEVEKACNLYIHKLHKIQTPARLLGKTRRLIDLKPYGRKSCTERSPEFPLPPASN
ncbi:MAG: hypothetical protein WBW78_10510 [Terrimicrobiaceae bacterium]